MTRRGLTLLELLVSMALSLLLIFALGQFFVYVTGTISDGRAIVEMGGNIRGAVKQLKDDLQQLTAPATPSLDPASGLGFIEIVEGAAWDIDNDANGTLSLVPAADPLASEGTDADGDGKMDTGTMRGDLDDILSFTIRTSGTPFVGQWYNPTTGTTQQVESNMAEVAWFTTFTDANGNDTWDLDEQRFLVRRQLLILPNLTLGTSGQPENYFQESDVSAHWDAANNRWVANSISDLTNRENRWIHHDLDFSDGSQNGLRAADAVQPAAFMPNPLQLAVGRKSVLQRYTLQGAKRGEDIVLPNLLALDVRVYDPAAPMYADSDGEAALQPGDPGFPAAYGLPMAQPIGWGCYVDMNYNRYLPAALITDFAGRPNYNPRNTATPDPNVAQYVTYDTWSTSYERDGNGIPGNPPSPNDVGNQFDDNVEDWALDGLDNDGQNGVDDSGEFETSPPYLTPLRGIQVRLRMYEPGTRQTRQATVVSSFAP